MSFSNTNERQGEIINCETHGDFVIDCVQIGGRYLIKDYCAKCVDDKDREEAMAKKQEQKKKEAENAEARRVNSRLYAGISKRNLDKTFDNYICESPAQEKNKQKCMDYVNNFPTEKSLLMLGSVGTGKTLLACAMLDSLVDKYNCRLTRLIDITRHLKSTWGNDSDEDEQGVINRYLGLDLLIIDEVGAQFGSDTEKLFIFDIIDGRYQDMKPTILISNLDIDGVKGVIGDRCVDRLREGGGSMIAFDWASKRK